MIYPFIIFRVCLLGTRLKMFEHWESSFMEDKHEKASWGSSFVSKLSESSTSLFSSLFSGDAE